MLDCVVVHLNYPKLNECLETLRRNTPELGKVILIDQSENPKDWGDLVDLHLKVKNLGWAKACNTGMRLSDADYVMCTNDDVRFVNKKWFQGILKDFDADPEIVILNPSTFHDSDASSNYVAYTMPGYEKYENEDMPDEMYDKLVCDYFYPNGMCMFAPVFKRSLMNKIKGVVPDRAWFNELSRYGGGEDYALQWHCFRSGLKCWSTGSSWVFHWWNKTLHPLTGAEGAKYDDFWLNTYSKKDKDGNIIERPDCRGTEGREDIPTVTIR